MEINRAIAPGDEMMRLSGEEQHYFDQGADALRWIELGVELAGITAQRILDFGCGHGRVMRFLRAAHPEADLVACDLDRNGADFCAQTFDARPVVSDPDPNKVTLDGPFDLIWSGSVFTHLSEWSGFLELLRSALDGVLIFTTAGERVIELAQAGERLGMTDQQTDQLIADFERDGFAYQEDPHGNGFTRTSQEWVRSQLSQHDLQLICFADHGWANRQDVYICRRS